MEAKDFIAGGIVLAVIIVVSFYLLAYDFPQAASVVSNSTGAWCPGTGARCSSIGAIFAVSSVVLPLVLLVVVLMFFLRKADLV